MFKQLKSTEGNKCLVAKEECAKFFEELLSCKYFSVLYVMFAVTLHSLRSLSYDCFDRVFFCNKRPCSDKHLRLSERCSDQKRQVSRTMETNNVIHHIFI